MTRISRIGIVALASAIVLGAAPAGSETAGVVFDDANANGVRDAHERGRAGIAVTNGRDVVRTDADGRYALPDGGAGFVSLTCPSDARCPALFHRGAGDFALVRQADERGFFFIHVA